MFLDPLLLVARLFMTGLFVLHVVNALKCLRQTACFTQQS